MPPANLVRRYRARRAPTAGSARSTPAGGGVAVVPITACTDILVPARERARGTDAQSVELPQVAVDGCRHDEKESPLSHAPGSTLRRRPTVWVGLYRSNPFAEGRSVTGPTCWGPGTDAPLSRSNATLAPKVYQPGAGRLRSE